MTVRGTKCVQPVRALVSFNPFYLLFFLKAVYFLDTMKTSTLPKVVNALEQDNDHFEMKQLAPMTDALKIISVSNKSPIIVV